jgi:hypothetical protein
VAPDCIVGVPECADFKGAIVRELDEAAASGNPRKEHAIRVERYELRENVAAAGKWRGSVGSIRQIAFWRTFDRKRGSYPPKGLIGGSDGTPVQLIWTKASGEVVHLPSKFPIIRSQPAIALRRSGRAAARTGTRLNANRRMFG